MNKWIISAVGMDQPGIVAALTQAFFELDCNLEDTSMTQLEDHFAVLIILDGPANLDKAALQEKLGPVSETFNLQLAAHPIVTHAEQANPTGIPWSMSVSGSDHLGIIYHVTQYLAGAKVNITHLSSKRMTKPNGEPLFLMALEVELPKTVASDTFHQELQALAKRQHLEIHAEPLEVYTL